MLVHHDASVNELLSEYGLEKHKDTVLVDWAATEAHQAKDDQAYR